MNPKTQLRAKVLRSCDGIPIDFRYFALCIFALLHFRDFAPFPNAHYMPPRKYWGTSRVELITGVHHDAIGPPTVTGEEWDNVLLGMGQLGSSSTAGRTWLVRLHCDHSAHLEVFEPVNGFWASAAPQSLL
mmetsp:Transcript_37847/g.67621  ORF Transcript_37847/g.67621 Transcript_37847/m.67621 type:complete len:131 (-) Transcript_37847:75-467(-)